MVADTRPVYVEEREAISYSCAYCEAPATIRLKAVNSQAARYVCEADIDRALKLADTGRWDIDPQGGPYYRQCGAPRCGEKARLILHYKSYGSDRERYYCLGHRDLIHENPASAAETPAPRPVQPPPRAEIKGSRLVGFPNLLDSPALQAMTFETFDAFEHPSSPAHHLAEFAQMALRAAHNFAADPSDAMLLFGPHGAGKTHLAAAIGHEVKGSHLMTVADLMDYLRFLVDQDEHSFYRAFQEVRDMPLLILDDMGNEYETPWSRDRLLQIIDHRWRQRLPTVLTATNDGIERRIQEAILARLNDPSWTCEVAMPFPCYRIGAVIAPRPTRRQRR